MVDPIEVLRSLNGRYCSDLRETQRALGKARWDHLAKLPVRWTVSDLFHLARREGLLRENDDGSFVFSRARHGSS